MITRSCLAAQKQKGPDKEEVADASDDDHSDWEEVTTNRGSRPRSPTNFFSENSGGIAISQYLENLGGDMARPRIKNLTSPIFDNF